ncbi:MAG: ATP-binding protein [Bryobacteraceae bacterium]
MFRPLASTYRLTQGLRFRLTLTYVVFFAILLIFLGVFFRQTVKSLYDGQIRNILQEEWAAIRGYLRVERAKGKATKPKVNWYYDRDDPEEALIVDRLKQVYLLTDADGTPLEIGPKYRELEVDAPEDIRQSVKHRDPVWKVKKNVKGVRYLIRSGVLREDDDKDYYVAIGRSYAEGDRVLQEFTRAYAIMLPLMIISASVLGWFMAGKALAPVNEVARAAQRITGSNLTVRIPTRGSDDELDRLIEAFNLMIERLDAAFRQTRQFSTDVSHELRTPLTAVRGQLEVALLAAKTPEQYKDAIVTALVDVERLSQTIRALLLLSQAESGHLVLQKQALDFTELTEDVVDQFQIPAEGANVTLTTHLASDCLIHADRIQMERLVRNLVSNALKYTPEGGWVRVGLDRQGDDTLLTVEDSGVGIAADHLPHIFDRFYRVPSVDLASHDLSPERGLGLGLSFVAWIVRAHQGQITVDSEPGKGSSFTVRFASAATPQATEPVTAIASQV